MDDIAIHTKPLPNETHEQHCARHCEYTHQILDKLEKNDLYLKPEKCAFKQEEIDYLGVIVGCGIFKMDPKKVKSVKSWAHTKNPTQICQFLGFTGYYRYFIQDYPKIAHPLLDLTKKTTVWDWGQAQEDAFNELKE